MARKRKDADETMMETQESVAEDNALETEPAQDTVQDIIQDKTQDSEVNKPSEDKTSEGDNASDRKEEENPARILTAEEIDQAQEVWIKQEYADSAFRFIRINREDGTTIFRNPLSEYTLDELKAGRTLNGKFIQCLDKRPIDGQHVDEIAKNPDARLLTQDELQHASIGTVVWMEKRNKYEMEPLVYFMDRYSNFKTTAWLLDMRELAMNFLTEYRFWSDIPTKAQREETEWLTRDKKHDQQENQS